MATAPTVNINVNIPELLEGQGLVEAVFRAAFRQIQAEIHDTARAKGWWDFTRNGAELIALMHSELSEALEAWRENIAKPSEKAAGFNCVEEEFADVFIRIMDASEKYGLDIPGALLAKMRFNKTRPHRHGGKTF